MDGREADRPRESQTVPEENKGRRREMDPRRKHQETESRWMTGENRVREKFRFLNVHSHAGKRTHPSQQMRPQDHRRPGGACVMTARPPLTGKRGLEGTLGSQGAAVGKEGSPLPGSRHHSGSCPHPTCRGMAMPVTSHSAADRKGGGRTLLCPPAPASRKCHLQD